MTKKIPVFTTIPHVFDPRLGRRYQPDPRSANFPICALLPRSAYATPKSKIWACGPVLNQGQEGSCVGHGFAHELSAFPYPIKNITHTEAVKIYKKAQELDDWPGSAYEGTSVLAGVKAVQALHPRAIESYRWANTIADVIATLGWYGPVVIGVNWYTGMYNTDVEGSIKVSGEITGGHCLLARGCDVMKNRIMLRNSWGPTWGKKGNCWISFQDFERLLRENGDCCVPVSRNWWK